MFRALRCRQVLWLWGGQVFSAMGDEVYNIALVWYAANLLNTGAGYVSAIQAGSIFVFGLIGGVWVDHHDNRRVMIFADILRALAVLVLPIFAHFAPLSLWVVVPVAVLVSSLTAFFNPALAAFVPQLTRDRELLQATNGLMETTGRFARIVGPGLMGVLSRQIPLIHYFTFDALSFICSALSVSRVKPEPTLVRHDQARLSVKATILSGYNLAKSDRVLMYTVYSGAVAGAAWTFVVPLGMTLLVRERIPGNIGTLGYLMSAYGVGNVLSNVIAANFTFQRPQLWIFSGRLLAGTGILCLAFSATLEQMMISSALTALGGPLTDLGYVNFVQKIFSGRDVARIFRYVMALGQGSLLLMYLTSSTLFQIFSIPIVLAAAAAFIFFSGVIGFVVDRKSMWP